MKQNSSLEEYLIYLHKKTFRNEELVKQSHVCGCFQCKKIFEAKEVIDWCDEDGSGPATALCPYCGIDSVLTDYIDGKVMEITPQTLEAMHTHFFE